MSLYDKAKVIFSAAAGAGNKDVAYNIKPVEKLKVDEYITNGGFDDGTNGWGASASISVSAGKAVFDGSGYMALYQNDIFEEGKVYKISVTTTIRKGEGIRIGTGQNSQDITGDSTPITKSGSHSFYYTGQGDANDHRIVIRAHNDGTAYDFDIDNVSVREVEQKANDFSFVRASDLTATYEGPDGLIKKTRENLLTYSNDFDNAIWAGSSTWTSGQSGYDGSTNAWSFNKNSPSGSDFYNQFFHGLHTFSIYAKKQSSAGLSIYAFYDWNGSSFDGNVRVIYNLDTGTELANQSGVISTTCEAIGSSWWRITMTVEQDDMRWYLYTTDGTQTLVDDVTVTLQDAQLEQGLVATPYIDRTDSYSKSTAGIQEDEPRYDYSLDNDAPPVLMLEPERRNLVKHSEYLSDYNTSNATKTINALTSPEGVNNAATINVTSNSGSVYAQSGSVVESVEAETKYTFSFYVKRGTNTENYLAVRDQNAEVFISEDVAYTASTTEWKRISHTFTTPAGCTSIRLYPQRYSSGGQGTTHLFGIQLEKGPYATSYIPTYGSAATREGEAHQSLSSFRCQLDKPLTKKYTFVVDVRVDNLERPTTNFDDIFVARSQGALFNDYPFRIEGYHDPNVDPVTYSLRVFSYKIGDTGSGTTTPHTNGIQLGVRNKIAIVFDEDSGIKIFVNGNSTPMAESTEPGQMHDVHFLGGGGNPRSKTFLYGVQAYDEALSDQDCVSLTTIS
jgi:hypothetical protein